MNMSLKSKVAIALVGVIIVIQFFQIDKTNPEVDLSQDFITLTKPPKDIEKLLRSACYDCHSHETSYPWYASFAPISWSVGNHIEEGREHLNFSIWGSYSDEKAEHKLEEIYEEVEEGEMPLKSYTWMHSEAKLSNEQVESLATWAKAKSSDTEDQADENEATEEEYDQD